MDDKQKVGENNKQARASFNKFRHEAAEEIAPTLLTGYRDGMSSSIGKLGGIGGGVSSFRSEYLVKRMIEAQERQMGNQGK